MQRAQRRVLLRVLLLSQEPARHVYTHANLQDSRLASDKRLIRFKIIPWVIQTIAQVHMVWSSLRFQHLNLFQIGPTKQLVCF